MRKIIISEFVTADGVIDDPGGADKTKNGGWSFQIKATPDQLKYKFDELFACDALLLGRVTYEGFAKAWPSLTDKDGFADRMNNLPKFVVSTTLKEAQWNNSKIIKDNIVEEVSKLKQQPGKDIFVYGSSKLAAMLIQHDLVDEYRLMVFPIVLSEGKRLFNEETGKKILKLVDTKKFDSGVILLTYQPSK